MIYNEKGLNSIAEAMLSEFFCVYCVNIKTDEYQLYTADSWYASINREVEGKDYFKDVAKIAEMVIHEDDKHIFLDENLKELLIYQVQHDEVHLTDYRIIIDGKPVYLRSKLIRGIGDDDCFILGVTNVDKEFKDRQKFDLMEKERYIFNQIAGSLAKHFDTLYYVDLKSNKYYEYSATETYMDMEVPKSGDDFFEESSKNLRKYVHIEDKERIVNEFRKDVALENLAKKKTYTLNYKLVINEKVRNCRCSILRARDLQHMLVCIENIDDEVNKDMERTAALVRANELARKDGLTGVKNMIAYRELEYSIQQRMESDKGHSPFAIIVCDINDLKSINDSKGHKVGNEYILSACRIICGIFAHSPVFRIGGDEFCAVLVGQDYNNRDILLDKLKKCSKDNNQIGEGPVVAIGIGVYDSQNDRKVSDVFERADTDMYLDKYELKVEKATKSHTSKEEALQIPVERKQKLDSLFEALAIINDEDYIFVCDMHYDYSRWSKKIIDIYGLPSEYMHKAGEIWKKFIHKDDRKVYTEAIKKVFEGIAVDWDVQYRAKKLNGEYSVCIGKGTILKDENGNMEYFLGITKDLNISSFIDKLTGLKNQYGFFEDIQTNIVQNKKMTIALLGIAKFSEVNEIYGYNFGNLVLQSVGRYLYEHVGSSDEVYRLDGTKFVVISTNQSDEELHERYDNLRAYFRKGLEIDDNHIMLELNSSYITVDNFNIDPHTIMTCLSFAYNESKSKRHGDLVEFNDVLGNGNRQKIERFHSIRASITQEYRGFYLLYQPVVDANTEKTIGAEALLRWKSEEHGVVGPDDFIPLLEQDPLFPKLGEWILSTAIRDAKKVLEKNPDFVLNVNLSYTQIERANFVDMVTEIVEREGYPPQNLCLEITERCRLLDIDLLKNIVVSLRGRGIQIALDDFGTGFSSVGVVKVMPFDIIKIDRSFVSKIEEDEFERTFLMTFIQIANICGANVCIEGIETEKMGDILRDYNVNSFQGYYYSKPIDLETLLDWMEDGK